MIGRGVYILYIVQGFSSWLSKNRDENPRMRALFGGDFELKILRMRGFSSRFLDNQLENPCILYIWTFFLNQSFISKNTHFERSILTQIGFSSNLMASGTA